MDEVTRCNSVVDGEFPVRFGEAFNPVSYAFEDHLATGLFDDPVAVLCEFCQFGLRIEFGQLPGDSGKCDFILITADDQHGNPRPERQPSRFRRIEEPEDQFAERAP